MPDFPYDQSRMAYLLELDGTECRYRAAVPIELLNDELGDDITEGERQAWIHANLSHILGAVTRINQHEDPPKGLPARQIIL